MARSDLTLLPLLTAVRLLSRWRALYIPLKLLHLHENISGAHLLAVALLQP